MQLSSQSRNRGLALVIVLAVIALAAVMGYALLSSASMQTQISSNSKSMGNADGAAESGVNLAMYYLQHPESASALNADGYWSGDTNISLGGDGSAALARVTVTRDATSSKYYDIESVGSVSGKLSRTLKARVYVESKYNTRYALAANADFVLPGSSVETTITGDIRTDGVISGGAGADLESTLEVDGSSLSPFASVSTGGASGSAIRARPSYPSTAAPRYAQLNITKSLPSYTYNGQTYTASLCAANVASNATLLANATTNPANVWYSNGDVTFGSNVTLNGTLIIVGSNRSLTINGSGSTIKPKAGVPALIVGKDLRFQSSNSRIDIDGLVWLGDDITTSSFLNSNLRLEIKGALMFGGGTPAISSSWKGKIHSDYDSSLVNIPDLTDVGQTPSSVRVVSWGNN